MILSNLVNLGYYIDPFLACMGQKEFEADRIAEALTDDGKKEFNPVHQAVKKAFTLGVHFMHKVIERLFMPLDKTDEVLNRFVWVILAD